MADKAFELPRSLIRKHGTNDPFRIAKELNIPVHFRSMKRQKAFCLCVMRNYSIHINEKLSEQMQRMACAHELGHIMLHKDLLRPEKGEKARQLVELELFDITSMTEYEANLFAANKPLPVFNKAVGQIRFGHCAKEHNTTIFISLPVTDSLTIFIHLIKINALFI